MEEKKQESNSFLEDLKGNIKLRLGNKLIFSYLITWCIWNWKFLFFIIFSGKSVELKLSNYHDYFSTNDAFIPIIGVTIYYLILDWFEGFFLFLSQWGVYFRLQRHIEVETLKIEAEIEISQERIDIINEFAKANKQELNQAVEINEKLQNLEKTTNDLQERMKGVKTISGNAPVPSNDPRTKTILNHFDTDKLLKDEFIKHAKNLTLRKVSGLKTTMANELIKLNLLDQKWNLTKLGNDVFYQLI